MANGIITLAKGENGNVSPLHGRGDEPFKPFRVNWRYQMRMSGDEPGFAGSAEIVYAVSGEGMSDFVNSVTIRDEEGKGIQLAADPDGSRRTPVWSWLRMKILEEYARQQSGRDGDSKRTCMIHEIPHLPPAGNGDRRYVLTAPSENALFAGCDKVLSLGGSESEAQDHEYPCGGTWYSCIVTLSAKAAEEARGVKITTNPQRGPREGWMWAEG